MSKEKLLETIKSGSEYERNRDEYLRRAKNRYNRTLQSAAQRLPRMIIEAKARAKKKGLDFNITSDDVKWNEVCPIFGVRLVLNNTGAGGSFDSPSLDRIDNDKGYVKGNVRIISNRANKLKNTMSYEECEFLLKNWYSV